MAVRMEPIAAHVLGKLADTCQQTRKCSADDHRRRTYVVLPSKPNFSN